MNPIYDTLVIGAGQAGLAAGYHLQRAGLRFAILEAAADPHGSWPQYYASLTLFSPARYSSLPGLSFPGDPLHYPARDEVVAYLARYAAHFGLPIIPHSRVTQVIGQEGGFMVTAADGTTYQARSLVAASGAFSRNCWARKVFPPPLPAMMRTLESANDGSNTENGMSCWNGVSTSINGEAVMPPQGTSTGIRSAPLSVRQSCSR